MQVSDRISRIDHLVYATVDLERGCDAIEALLDVRPVTGGRHPDWGTHNALLGLGEACYLEVIAPDPAVTHPRRTFPLGNGKSSGGGLVTWVLQTGRIERLASEARAAGVPIGAVYPGSRRQSDGTLLAWQLTDPAAMPLGGAVPFLIDWGETPHPATVLPAGGTLSGLRIEHPQPEAVRQALSVLGVDLPVSHGSHVALNAEINTPLGTVLLY